MEYLLAQNLDDDLPNHKSSARLHFVVVRALCSSSDTREGAQQYASRLVSFVYIKSHVARICSVFPAQVFRVASMCQLAFEHTGAVGNGHVAVLIGFALQTPRVSHTLGLLVPVRHSVVGPDSVLRVFLCHRHSEARDAAKRERERES